MTFCIKSVKLYAERRDDMRRFDYSFLRTGVLPARFLNLAVNIAGLKTMAGVRKENYEKVFTELESVAKVQSVKSSNAIEGIVTSDERIAAIVNGNSAPLNHNEAEIAGYRDALAVIHEHYRNIDFRCRDILRLHAMLMGLSGDPLGGKYKTEDNVILEVDSDGRRRVRVRPTAAEETADAMEQLELAYMEARADAEGIEVLMDWLKQIDPEAAAKLHLSDRKRIIRALEVYLETGQTITAHNRKTQAIPPRYQPLWLGLDFAERQALYDRIDLRVDIMLQQGLVEEIQELLDSGIPEKCTAMQAIGYKEFVAALRGNGTVAQAAEEVKKASRHYAKRQLTWFRRNGQMHWLTRLPGEGAEEILAKARQVLHESDN